MQVVVIGAGRMGAIRTEDLVADPRVDEVLIVNRTPDRATALARQFGARPLAWADLAGLPAICRVLANLGQFYGEDRYRISPLIQQQVSAGKTIHER